MTKLTFLTFFFNYYFLNFDMGIWMDEQNVVRYNCLYVGENTIIMEKI